MFRLPRKGMVLFVTLLVAAIIALFLAGAVQLLPTLGYSAANLSHKEQAVLAAQSGLEYARSRLQSDPGWRGNGTGLVVDTPELKVIEDHGNIFGILEAPNGDKSLFRFRFNFQNGTDDPDEVLDDPDIFVDSEYVSFNNLLSANSREQIRAELIGGVYKITDTSPAVELLPKYTAAIVVEGFAGPAVRGATVSNPNIDPTAKYTRQVLETYLTRPGFLNVDSAVMAASQLNADMLAGGTMRVDSDNVGEPAKVRTLTAMDVFSTAGTANYVTPPSGQVVVGTGEEFELNGAPSTSPAADNESSAQQAPRWLKLGFDQITRAQPSDARVRAGTYMWRAGAGGPRLEYFAQDYTGVPPVGSGTVVSSGDNMLSSGSNAIDLTPSNFRLRVKEDILVEPQGGVTGFTVIAEPGLMGTTGRRPETLLNSSSAENSVIFSNDDGPVFLEGKIDGSGSVTSGGDITFQGTSALEADPTMSVALYAKGDVNLKAIPDEVLPAITAAGPASVSNGKGKGGKGKGKGKGHANNGPGPGLADNTFSLAQDVAFGGIVYAQGSFNVDLKQQDQAGLASGTNHGSLFIKGVLATFGGDPETDSGPGMGSGGNVNMEVKDARFIYDPDYLDALQDLNGPVRLDKSFWTAL